METHLKERPNDCTNMDNHARENNLKFPKSQSQVQMNAKVLTTQECHSNAMSCQCLLTVSPTTYLCLNTGFAQCGLL